MQRASDRIVSTPSNNQLKHKIETLISLVSTSGGDSSPETLSLSHDIIGTVQTGHYT